MILESHKIMERMADKNKGKEPPVFYVHIQVKRN